MAGPLGVAISVSGAAGCSSAHVAFTEADLDRELAEFEARK
jgi:hypothetical protein